MGRWMLEHDGPDPRFRPGGGLVTTTGRVGHVTGLQFDTLSKTYAGENKNQQVWAGLWGFWKKVVDKAGEQGKEPLLRIEPTNEDARGVPIMHIITEDRHAELLRYEREALEAQGSVVISLPPRVVRQERSALGTERPRPFSKEDQLGRKPVKRRA